MDKKVNKYILKKRRKKIIKKIILGLFALIIAIIIFIYKSPIFNLKKIYFNGLVTLNNETLQEELKYNIGQNIFVIDYKKIEDKLRENPYIKEIKIKKKGIDSININIVENKIAFYAKSNDKIKTINNYGVIVEELDNIGNRNLIKLSGLDISEKNIGSRILEEDVSVVLERFYKMTEVMPENLKFSEINIVDLNNIICYIGEIEIILGNSTDLLDKVNIALNIIEQNTLKKGYIDLSFDGSPVIFESQ